MSEKLEGETGVKVSYESIRKVMKVNNIDLRNTMVLGINEVG